MAKWLTSAGHMLQTETQKRDNQKVPGRVSILIISFSKMHVTPNSQI